MPRQFFVGVSYCLNTFLKLEAFKYLSLITIVSPSLFKLCSTDAHFSCRSKCRVWSLVCFLKTSFSHTIRYLKLPFQLKRESCFKELMIMMSFHYIYKYYRF